MTVARAIGLPPGDATLLMVLEKLPQVAHYVIKPVGVLFVGAGVVLLVFATVGN